MTIVRWDPFRKITANFKDGILRVEIPKPEGKRPEQITINVDSFPALVFIIAYFQNGTL